MTEDISLEERTPTLASFSMTARGFETEDHARSVLENINQWLLAISRIFDLSCLDGITVAYDYGQALVELDRGVEVARLEASSGLTLGVAMTPAVLRDGVVKSHILFNAPYIVPLLDQQDEYFEHALHVIAHESAHVEINAAFDRAFPGTVLQEGFSSSLQAIRWNVADSCWQEYAATMLSAGIGQDQTDGYVGNLLRFLEAARPEVKQAYREYMLSRMAPVAGINAEWKFVNCIVASYGNLLKYASYCLGNLSGLGIDWRSNPELSGAISGSWFEVYFDRISTINQGIMENFGEWTSRDQFWLIGDLVLEMLYESGILLTDGGDQGVRFDFNSSMINSLA